MKKEISVSLRGWIWLKVHLPVIWLQVFREILVLLHGINYCPAWAAWIKLFTSARKNITKLLELTCFFSLLGFPEGSSLKLIKSNKSRKTLGEEAWGINDSALHDYTPLVLWDKNTLNHWLNHRRGSLSNSDSHYIFLLFGFWCWCTWLYFGMPQLLIPFVNLEIPSESAKPLKKKKKKKTRIIFDFLFVVLLKYVPPLLARASVGKPDGNFYYPDWSNNDVSCERSTANVRWIVLCVCYVQYKNFFWPICLLYTSEMHGIGL